MRNGRYSHFGLVGLAVLVTTLGLAPTVALADGSVDFFKQNGGGRKNYPFATCRLPLRTATYKLNERKVQNCGNDDVRSMELSGTFPRGFTVYVYDSPDGRRNDDWTSIVVKRDLPGVRIVVGTFENDFETQEIKVSYHRKNGLDGKVSRIEIRMP